MSKLIGKSLNAKGVNITVELSIRALEFVCLSGIVLVLIVVGDKKNYIKKLEKRYYSWYQGMVAGKEWFISREGSILC